MHKRSTLKKEEPKSVNERIEEAAKTQRAIRRYIDFLRKRFPVDVEKIVDSLQAIGRKFNQSDFIDLEKELEKIPPPLEKKPTIAIVGFMNSGKSSLINLLVKLGDNQGRRVKICPEQGFAFTNLIWRLRYGKKKKFILKKRPCYERITNRGFQRGNVIDYSRYFDEPEEEIHDLEGMKDNEVSKFLRNYVKGLRESKEKWEEFKKKYELEVVVEYDAEFLLDFDIVDSPGDGESKEMNNLIFGLISQSDIVIYVGRVCDGHVNENMKMHLELLKGTFEQQNERLVKKFFYVGNFADKLIPDDDDDEEDEYMDNFAQNIQKEKKRCHFLLNFKKMGNERKAPHLFFGRLPMERIYLTCCQQRRNIFFENYFPEIARLHSDLLKLRNRMMFTENANRTRLLLRNSVNTAVNTSMKMKGKLVALDSLQRQASNANSRLRKELRKLTIDLLTNLKLGTKAVFDKVDALKEVVSKEEIPDIVFKYKLNLKEQWKKLTQKKKARRSVTKEQKETENLIGQGDKGERAVHYMKVVLRNHLTEEFRSVFEENFNDFSQKSIQMFKNCISLMSVSESRIDEKVFKRRRNTLVESLKIVGLGVSSVFWFLPLTGYLAGNLIARAIKYHNFSFDREWREGIFDQHFKEICKRKDDIVMNLMEMFEETAYDFTSQLLQNLSREMKATVARSRMNAPSMKTFLQRLLRIELDVCELEYTLSPRFVVEKKIDQGSFGIVSAGRFQGKPVAIKEVRVLNQGMIDSVATEINLLKTFNHPSILKVVGVHYDETTRNTKELQVDHRVIFILTELHPGNLRQVITDSRIGISSRLKYIIDICTAMEVVHKHRIFHRDLKPSNILVNGDRAILCDFGLAKRIMFSKRTPNVGTALYVDPIIFNCNDEERMYDTKVDVFSFGIVLYELYQQLDSLAGFVNTPYECFEKMKDGTWDFQNDKILKDLTKVYKVRSGVENGSIIEKEVLNFFQTLVNDCVVLDGAQRPSFSDILKRLTKFYRDKKFYLSWSRDF